jgi:hypothetical protein
MMTARDLSELVFYVRFRGIRPEGQEDSTVELDELRQRLQSSFAKVLAERVRGPGNDPEVRRIQRLAGVLPG